MTSSAPCGHLCYCRKPEMAECISDQRAEIERLRVALQEIADHRIDSEFASLEKRNMAVRALKV